MSDDDEDIIQAIVGGFAEQNAAPRCMTLMMTAVDVAKRDYPDDKALHTLFTALTCELWQHFFARLPRPEPPA